MRVYYFVNEQYGLLDLEHRRLKIARVNDVNDPFEVNSACSDAKARLVIRDLKAQLHERFGMLCFSLDWSNPVQWSHYADGHRGMCLGFDVNEAEIERVAYRRQRPKADMYVLFRDQETGEAEMRVWFRTKYAHWKYEREVRMFLSLDDDPIDGIYFQPFDPKNLRLAEVIVGERSGLHRQQIIETLGDLAPHVELTKARLAFRSYKVTRQRMQSMWP